MQETDKKPPIPLWAWIFAVTCGIIPFVTLGGAIPGAIGFGGAGGCIGIGRKASLPMALRVTVCAVITVVCWALLIALFGSEFLNMKPSGPSDAGQTRAVLEASGRYAPQIRKSTDPNRGDDFELLERTDQIPCKVGERFGIRIRSWNIPTNRTYTVRQETEHPPITQPDGSVQTKAVSEFEVPAGGIPGPYFLWHFKRGYEHELVAGDWTIVVFIDDFEVVRKVFHVQKDQPEPKQATSGRK
jgi:hypothetical protein